MTLRLLGTGGADGIPSLFGDDPVSTWAREHGGHEVRTRAAALIDEGLKIDLPPETGVQLIRDGLRASDWDVLLFTHSDDDHFALAEIQYALFPFSDAHELPFSIYGNARVIAAIRDRYPDWPMDLIEVHSFVPFQAAGYRITPLRARHTPNEECLNYLVERDGRRIVYATDTGFWPEETFEFLAKASVNLLVIECTDAFHPSSYEGHLDLQCLREMLERLRADGALDESCRVVTTHHAAVGGARHCDLQEVLPTLGAEPGYDGMIVEV